MERHYRFVKSYRDDRALRESFFGLAKKTFDIDFKTWYEAGYWGDGYIPFSIALGNEIVANVSVNRMAFDEEGRKRNYIQLGTVMTDEKYRNKGLIRQLMGEVLKEYEGKTEGFYLFANDSVLDFYPKFGFQKKKECQYRKQVEIQGAMEAVAISMEHESARERLRQAVKNSAVNSRFSELLNEGIIMFYMTLPDVDIVYYIEAQDAYVIAEAEKETLVLYNIFSREPADPDKIIGAFGNSVKTVVFAFTPLDTEGMELRELHEEDTTLFVWGRALEEFEQRKMMFPALSHA